MITKKPQKEGLDLIHVLGICTYKELVIFSSGSVTCSAKIFAVREKNVGMHSSLTERAPRNPSPLCLYISDFYSVFSI